MDLVEKDIKSLQKEVEYLKEKLDASEAAYYNLVEKTNLHLKELFDSSNDLIQIFKPTGEFRFVNQIWRHKLGYTEDEVFDLKFVDTVHPDYRKQTLQTLLKLTAGSRLERFETVLISKYGKSIYVTGKLTCVFEYDEPTEFRCVFYDITERFRAERAQSLFFKIASLTITQNSLDQLYESIFNELNEILKVKNFSIITGSPRHSALNHVYAINEYETKTGKTLSGDVEKALIQYTFERAKPLIIYEDGIQKIARQKQLQFRDPLPKIWLGVLLQLDNQPFGILSIFSYRDQSAYNHKDLELLDFIAGQVSLAMQRKLNEEKIQNQAARLSAIFESSTHQIWSIDKDFRYTSFNQNYAEAFYEHHGFEPHIGMKFSGDPPNAFPTKTQNFWTEKYNRAFEGKVLNFQTSQKNLTGKKTWRDIFLNPIFLPDGRIEEISVIANDITEKKLAETAIKESEEKFRNIFESFQDVYFRCDLNGVISMVSPSVREVIGYSQHEVIGKNITEFFISKTTMQDLLSMLYEHKQVRNFEGAVVTKSRKEIQLLSNVRLIKRRSSAFEIEGVARDITQLKKTNIALREAKELAEKSLKVKERFLANMSHEIRTPMNGIIGMIDLLGSTSLSREQSEYIKTIKKSSDTLLNILNDILDLSKIEAGKMSFRKDPVKLEETCQKIYELYSQQASLSNNSLFYHLDEKIPEYILTDETRLMQILSNLTSNAIKFSPKKGNINISIRVLENKGKDFKFKVAVKDSGIGISQEDTRKLFRSFSQLDSSSSKTYSGTGLGLVISKELVKSMGGDIGVVSTPGLGSTFWFTFQAISITEKEVNTKKEENVFVRQFTNTSPKVLLVDDNDINRNVASTILKKSGCEVIEASSGFEAIEKVKKSKFDLIFMDIQMPDMDGIAATAEIKQLKLDHLPPIVAMTAYSMEEDRKNFLSKGLDDYIPKPIKASTLISKVKSWLNFEPKKVGNQFLSEETKELVLNQNTLHQLNKYGGKELIQSALKDFDMEATAQVRNAKRFYDEKAYEKMRVELHTLKGNAGTLGAERLCGIATTIEKSLKENKFGNLYPMLNKLETSLAEFKESYQEFINT